MAPLSSKILNRQIVMSKKEELENAYSVIRWLWEGRNSKETPLTEAEMSLVFKYAYENATKQTTSAK